MISKEVLARVEVYKKSGWKAYVQVNLDQLVEQSPEREERDFRMTLLSVAFEFDSFRSDPRFKELVRRMHLPE